MTEVVMSEFWSTDLEEPVLAEIEIASQVVSSPTTIDVDVPIMSNVSVKAPVKQIKTQPLKTRATKSKTTSDIWDHFAKIEGSDPCRAKCNYCDVTYAADSKLNGTTNMWVHIDTRCKKYPFRIEKKQKTMYEFSAVKDDGTCSLVGSKPKALDIQAIREALSKMYIIDELPFSMVEGEGFKNLIRVLEPRFTVPCRITVASDCFRLYDKEKNKMKSLLKDQRLSLTTYCWTSIQNLNYLTLTAHFIDDNWNLRKKILNFCVVESHKGIIIGKKIESCLIEWGFDKIMTMTVDNASSNSSALDYLKLCNWRDVVREHSYLHVRCSAHIINLIVRDGLKEQSNSILRIRYAMKFVRSSPERTTKFKECVLMERIDCKKGVCLDVDTRWNSTYLMLQIAIKYQKAFNRLKRDDSSYEQYFLGDGPGGSPEKADWEKAESFVQFLKLFYDATLAFSGTKYVTSALFLRQFLMLHLSIKNCQSSSDIVMRRMAESMRAKFNKYWVNASCMNNLVFLGVVFDPKYKFKHVQFCFRKIYEDKPEIGKLLISNMNLELEALFKQYMERHSSTEKVGNFMVSTSSSKSFETNDTWNILESQFQMELEKDASVQKKCELTQYLNEPCEKDVNLDILQWWKVNASRFPILSKFAKDVLAIPVSTVASEQAFSTGGRVLNEFRSSLNPKTVQMLICGQIWFRKNDDPIDINAMLEDVEKYEDIANDIDGSEG